MTTGENLQNDSHKEVALNRWVSVDGTGHRISDLYAAISSLLVINVVIQRTKCNNDNTHVLLINNTKLTWPVHAKTLIYTLYATLENACYMDIVIGCQWHFYM